MYYGKEFNSNISTFKNSLFSLNDLGQFHLVSLGECDDELDKNMTKKEIIENIIGDLDFGYPPDGFDKVGFYSADLTIQGYKSWTDCGYEYDSEIEIYDVKQLNI